MRLIILAIIAVLLMLTPPASAQSVPGALSKISELNKSDLTQNPRYETGEDILSRKMVNADNQVVGTIQNVIVAANGRVDALEVSFDRLRLQTPVYLDFADLNIGTTVSSYKLDFEDNQIVSLYPELLAGIETAAGSENIYSLKALQGLPLRSETGRLLGRVEDLVFDNNGEFVRAYSVSSQITGSRGRRLSLPFDSVSISSTDLGNREAVLGEAYTEAFLTFLD